MGKLLVGVVIFTAFPVAAGVDIFEKVLFVGAFCFDAFEFDVALLECGAL